MTRNTGFTLIELMIVVAVLSILMVIAVPAYQNYVDTAEESVLITNANSMSIFQEDFFLRTGAYANDLANIAAITALIGWAPRTDDGYTYAIAASDGTEYSVTVTSPGGDSACVTYPDIVRC